ncbi:calcium-binding and coiled-coil domain-containing protein 2 isoform X2 [Hippopotamus amphibius kiboko]|uniref:calcium-binding and coiled-coil domain-containing protein 2 isoform X2 n=1 Tax=Hippopotamus amphibius kiboko TaxID=575201 RepID=UPI002598E349|nr:calcium-binding and coiled-coil domain-containing protein 2 isoform X2 [Hippopotamus amphibius kiboko]
MSLEGTSHAITPSPSILFPVERIGLASLEWDGRQPVSTTPLCGLLCLLTQTANQPNSRKSSSKLITCPRMMSITSSAMWIRMVWSGGQVSLSSSVQKMRRTSWLLPLSLNAAIIQTHLSYPLPYILRGCFHLGYTDVTTGEVEEIEQHNKELCKENKELKDSCVSLQEQNSDMQAKLQKKQEELETLMSINKKLEQTMKEQKDCWETELLQLKEQNQKMSSENEKMGVRVDQLQAQLSTQEKEMEKLVQGVQDKTEQLEHLEKENGQLFLSLTEQREQQKKLEWTVEEMKQKETTAAKKQQELTDQNFDLSKRLSENKIIYSALQKEKERMEKENDLLKRENSRLLSYTGLNYDSLPYQVPTSDQGGLRQNPGLVYGNPYSGIQESSAPSLLSIKKCPTCKSDFPDDFFDHTLEQHMQTLSLNCPICDKTFPAKEKQIFEDHVFCHTL